MKRLFHILNSAHWILTILCLAMLVSCTDNKPKGSYYGNEFEVDSFLSLDEYLSSSKVTLSGKVEEVQLSGEIEEVCQSKGCWMILKTSDETKVRVTFKDYGFFVPKDAMGKKVYLQGEATMNVLDSATLKHFAEDAGKSVSEMSSVELSVVSDGVLII